MMTNFVTINSDVIYPTTFTAIDVETATREGSICQIGMTVVKDGKVDKVISRLVRPYMNEYDAFYTGIHGINAMMTRDCQDFLNVWGELAQIIEGPLVAHNARTFDYPVIRKNVELYDMDYELPEFMDTLDIYPAKLDVILDFLKVDRSMHHNAEFDSRICAELMLAANGLGSFADGIDPDDLMDYREEYKATHSKNSGMFAAKRIPKELREKDLDACSDKDNMFYDKRIVITGDFPIFRQDLAKKIHDMGARITSSISSMTDFVFVGENAGPSKMDKVSKLMSSGNKIKMLTIDELKQMNMF